MATNLDAEYDDYIPITGNWFRVTVVGVLAGVGWPILVSNAAFRKVTGLSRTYGKEEVKEGGNNTSAHILWNGPATHGEVTLEYGFIHTDALWQWCRDVEDGGDFRKSVIIEQFGHDALIPLRIIMLTNAWPIEWKQSDLDASGNQMAVESLKLVYDDLIMGTSLLSLIETSSDLAKASIATTEGTTLSVDFQFNPNSLSFDRNTAWTASSKSQHTDYPSLTVPSSALDSMTLNDVIFDASQTWDTEYDVVETVETLYRMTLVQSDLGSQPRPPRVLFKWNDFQFFGGLDSVTANYTLFDSSGVPIRAKVKLTLKGQLIRKGCQQTLLVSEPTSDASGGGSGC